MKETTKARGSSPGKCDEEKEPCIFVYILFFFFCEVKTN